MLRLVFENAFYSIPTSIPNLYVHPLIKIDGNMPYNEEKEGNLMSSTVPTARLEARISTHLHAMLKRAAELEGRTMTDFVVSAVQDAAQRAIEQAEVVKLTLADQECFARALLAPALPVPALARAFARRRKLLGTE